MYPIKYNTASPSCTVAQSTLRWKRNFLHQFSVFWNHWLTDWAGLHRDISTNGVSLATSRISTKDSQGTQMQRNDSCSPTWDQPTLWWSAALPALAATLLSIFDYLQFHRACGFYSCPSMKGSGFAEVSWKVVTAGYFGLHHRTREGTSTRLVLTTFGKQQPAD